MRKVFKCNPLTIDGNVKPRSVSGTLILVKRVHYFSVRRLNESDAFKVHRSHEKLVPIKIMEVIIMEKFTVMMENSNGVWSSEKFEMCMVAMQYAEEMANHDDVITIQVITPDDIVTVKEAATVKVGNMEDKEMTNNITAAKEMLTKVAIKNRRSADYISKDKLITMIRVFDSVTRKTTLKRSKRDQLIVHLSNLIDTKETPVPSDKVETTALIIPENEFKIPIIKKQAQTPKKAPVVDNKQTPSTRDKQIRMTKRLMQKIAAYCKGNKKKGFGTTVSSYMLLAYIAEIQFNMPKLKGHEKELTQEQLKAMTETRNWLIKNGYLKQATIKDEKGFVFYNENYDGNRKGVLYDINKFKTTGKTQTTSYLVTNKIAKWLA